MSLSASQFWGKLRAAGIEDAVISRIDSFFRTSTPPVTPAEPYISNVLRLLAAGPSSAPMSARMFVDLYSQQLEQADQASRPPPRSLGTSLPQSAAPAGTPPVAAVQDMASILESTKDLYKKKLIQEALSHFRSQAKTLADMLVNRERFTARATPDFIPPWLKNSYKLAGTTDVTSRARDAQAQAFKDFAHAQAQAHILALSAQIDEVQAQFTANQVEAFIRSIHGNRKDFNGQPIQLDPSAQLTQAILADATSYKERLLQNALAADFARERKAATVNIAAGTADMQDDTAIRSELAALKKRLNKIEGKGQPGRSRSRATSDERKPRSKTPSQRRGRSKTPVSNGKRSVSFNQGHRPRSSSNSSRRSVSRSSNGSHRQSSTGNHARTAQTRPHTPTRGRGRGRGRGRTRD